MEKAVQTLGRLPVFKDDQGRTTRPDLTDANLQAMDLSGLDFEKARLSGAQLQGANLTWAELQGANLTWAQLQWADLFSAELQGANLSWAEFDPDTDLHAAALRGAACRSVDFTTIPKIADHLEHLFGDDTVKLPPNITAPARFSQTYEDYEAFLTAWRAFQRSIGQDPENPT